MSTYVEVNGNPDDVTGTGARLKAAAQSFGAQAKSILGEIQSIDAQQPWGSDEAGHAFLTSYNQTPQGSHTPFSQALQDDLSTAGEHLDKAGDGIMLAMVEYQSTDSTNSDSIKSV